MKHFALASLLGLLWGSQLLPAQTAKPVVKSSGRYLFIVETSSAMQRRAKAVQEAMRAMLSYDLNGQLRPGDTLGIWTCNEQLYAGRFPLEAWTPEFRETIIKHVLEFLKKQRYEKETRWERTFPELERVVRGSENLTVLLLSSGDKEFQGTPFDRQINLAYTQWRDKMQRTRMPFITVLRARNGQFLNYTVNMAPWPVEFPNIPQEKPPTIVAKPPQKTSAKITAPVPSPAPRPPLILDMSKSAKPEATKSAEAENAPAEQSQPPTPAPNSERVETVSSTPTPVAIPKPPETLPAAAVAPAAAQVVTPPPTPAVPSETPKSEVANAPHPTMATPAVPSPLTAKAAEEHAASLSAPVPPVSMAAPKLDVPPVGTPTSVKVEMPSSPVAGLSPEEGLPSPGGEPEPTPGIQPAVGGPPPKPDVQPAAEPAEVRKFAALPVDTGVDSSSPQAAAALPPLAPAQTAMTAPPTAVSSKNALIIGAIVVLAIGAGLRLWLVRRARAAVRASLITRSMDRPER